MNIDTPKTDDAVMRAVSQGMRLAPLAEFARELERANALLREDNDYLREELREANRLLTAFAPESARAAIDAARKEAQP
jgi:hypothetical protein